MNPVLLKPTGERTSQVVVMGAAVGEQSARDYHDGKDGLRPVVLAALADLREPLRRGDLRGRRRRGRDQPAGARPGQRAAGGGGRPACGRGRRHRPRRGVRLAARHRLAAARRPAAVGAGVRDQPVPGRPVAARRRHRRARAPQRRPHPRRGADGRRHRPRRRGLARPRPLGHRGCRPRSSTSPPSASPTSPTSATSTRCGWSRRWRCAGCGRPPPWAAPTSSCCPGRRPPAPTSTGSGRRAWPRRWRRAAPRWSRSAPGPRWWGRRSTTPTASRGRPAWSTAWAGCRCGRCSRAPRSSTGPRACAVDGPGAGERVAGYRIHHGRVAGDGCAPWLVADDGTPLGWCAGPGGGHHAARPVRADALRAAILRWATRRRPPPAARRQLRRRPARPGSTASPTSWRRPSTSTACSP